MESEEEEEEEERPSPHVFSFLLPLFCTYILHLLVVQYTISRAPLCVNGD